MIAIAKALPDVQIKEVLFSGGEPFLRRDMTQVISAIDSSRTRVYIASNGSPIQEQLVLSLKKAGVAGIDISLDGHTPELHKIVRLHTASFDHAVRAITLCERAGLPLRVTSVIVPETANHVIDLIRLLVNLRVSVLVLQTVLSSGGRAIEHPDLILSKIQVDEVDKQVQSARLKWGRSINIDFRASESGGGAEGCPAGHNLLNISAEGDVSTCSWLYKISPKIFTLGNIKTESLKDCLSRVDQVMGPWTKQTKGCPIPIVNAKTGDSSRNVHP
jgi:MoaA/NifB/PqqE/SkfB family radical SAM enzyme